jgi:hypothetical protein
MKLLIGVFVQHVNVLIKLFSVFWQNAYVKLNFIAHEYINVLNVKPNAVPTAAPDAYTSLSFKDPNAAAFTLNVHTKLIKKPTITAPT